MNDWKLLPQPEQFTELYFNNYLSLPKTSVAGKPFTFSFTIHNIENATTVYPYAVYFKYPDGARTTLRTGSVTLANDATTTIPITYTFQTSDLHGEVVVALTELNQTIDFILPNTNP
jgi:hypothetical protein